jgi:uncharacterized repeat protein (TIGR01451 family)
MSFPSGVTGLAQGIPELANDVEAIISFTLLHTNDFHGNLQPAGSNPGMARLAYRIDQIRTSVGAENTLLLDAGDIMQGTLLSNLFHGESTIDLYNYVGYDAATFGNHEFDWGQDVIISRTQEADFPFVTSNIVNDDTGDCATAGWQTPAWATPWITRTVGAPGSQVVVGIFGVTSQETPYITLAENTAGLCFKDPAQSISHHYNDVINAGAEVLVVVSHIGYTDGGYGYGFEVYGDQTLAQRLTTAGMPVHLIIGGHSHTNLTSATIPAGTNTYVVQAHYAGRRLGRADLTYDTASHQVTISWSSIAIGTSDPQDGGTVAQIDTWANDPWYQEQINRVVGYTNVDIFRNYNGDSEMGKFVNDAIYQDLNTDAVSDNDVDMVFNNPGGLRADIDIPASYTGTYTITHGMMYNVLPFGNATVVGTMTGAEILDLLNQSATLFKGALQVSGVRYTFYRYQGGAPLNTYAWGAYDIEVYNQGTSAWEPLVITQTYRIATNEFLAPAGQDGFLPFKYTAGITYWGDMLDGVERWVSQAYTLTSPYSDTVDGRITRNGADTYNPADPTQVIPVTILHHNDSHGNTDKGAYVGYTQLATLINQERAENPDRTLLLSGGDNIQGDAMMYYFKAAFTGYGSDGAPLDPSLTTNPLIAEMNTMTYTAMTLGNHEFNFGRYVFTGTLGQANFPLLQANIYDDGRYGLDEVGVQPYVTATVPGPSGPIQIAILGLGNHRVPNYELPSNILGLTFTNPIDEAAARVPALDAANDAVVALTHIGFTTNPTSVEVDNNVDTYLAANVLGIDAIIGAHSHTNPDVTKTDTSRGIYKYLPAILGNPAGLPVLINQAHRYNNTLGEVVLGFLPDGYGGYEVVTRAGTFLPVATSTIEDPTLDALITPYTTWLNTYVNTPIGQTYYPLDALTAYTEETNAANLQADSAVWELAQHGINADFYLSGAMSNRKVADTATPTTPYTLTVNNMFTLMPYENSLVTLNMNGPQLKAVLERGYRNYYYYKYVPGRGGYSYYTTCMLDTNAGGQITYRDTYPALPDGNNVISLVVNGQPVDFTDANTYYLVATVNYLAAGSCNFNNSGQTLWPLAQIVDDTQYYVRDSVINYVTDQGIISPTVEGRLVFEAAPNLSPSSKSVADASGDGLAQLGEVLTYTIEISNTGGVSATVALTDALPAGLTYVPGSLQLPVSFSGGFTNHVLTAQTTADLPPATQAEIVFAAQVTQALPNGGVFSNQIELADQFFDYTIAAADISMALYHAVELEPEAASQDGDPGEVVTYTLTLTNAGNEVDVITLSATGVWAVHLPTTVYTLAASGAAEVIVHVTIPTDTLGGEFDLTTVTATSSDDITTDESELTTIAGHLYGVVLDPATDSQNGNPGEGIEYTLHLTNTGNFTDVITLDATGGWDVHLPTEVYTLAVGESTDVAVQVTIPAGALAGDSDLTTVTATSSDGVTAAESELTTTANHIYGVTLEPASAIGGGDPGDVVTYTLTLTNAGNEVDVITLSATGVWAVHLPTTVYTLAANNAAEVIVHVTIPTDTLGGEFDLTTVTATSSDDMTTDESALTTAAGNVYGFALFPLTAASQGMIGAEVEYVLHLVNTSNVTETFTFSYTGNTWVVTLPEMSAELGVGESVDIVVRVSIPLTATDTATDTVSITVVASDEGAETAVLTTTAVWYHMFLPIIHKP